MIAETIFKDAKFGDKFLTRDGRIARFVCYNEVHFDEYSFLLLVEGKSIPYYYNGSGKYQVSERNIYDIVSRYQEQNHNSLPNDAEIEVMSKIKPDAIELAKWVRNIANTLISTENPIGKYADAVRKIQELTIVDEKKLDKLAKEAYPEEYIEIPYHDYVDSEILRIGFKAGYICKAKENKLNNEKILKGIR